jgi:hypothetical protein
MDKQGLDLSWVLTPDDRLSGLRVKTIDGKSISIYQGKSKVASFVNGKDSALSVETIRATANQIRSSAPTLEQKGEESGREQ